MVSLSQGDVAEDVGKPDGWSVEDSPGVRTAAGPPESWAETDEHVGVRGAPEAEGKGAEESVPVADMKPGTILFPSSQSGKISYFIFHWVKYLEYFCLSNEGKKR